MGQRVVEMVLDKNICKALQSVSQGKAQSPQVYAP